MPYIYISSGVLINIKIIIITAIFTMTFLAAITENCSSPLYIQSTPIVFKAIDGDIANKSILYDMSCGDKKIYKEKKM